MTPVLFDGAVSTGWTALVAGLNQASELPAAHWWECRTSRLSPEVAMTALEDLPFGDSGIAMTS